MHCTIYLIAVNVLSQIIEALLTRATQANRNQSHSGVLEALRFF